MITERTIVRDLSSAKRERYEAIIKEAAEQSGRMELPELADVINFEKVIQTVDGKNSFILHPTGAQELSDFSLSEINLLIGPEGGFSGQEIELAEKQGIKVARFGARILRAETACVATATKILYC
jgi:16S rRNA (uracil1498-N3)-methyltransferase